MTTTVQYFNIDSENLDVLREFDHFHTYLVGQEVGRVTANNPAHLGTVVWTHLTSDGDFTVAMEEVKIGQRSDNPHYNWLNDPAMRNEVFDAGYQPCYVCGENINGEDTAEVVFGTVHGVCHAECAVQAVERGVGVWA